MSCGNQSSSFGLIFNLESNPNLESLFSTDASLTKPTCWLNFYNAKTEGKMEKNCDVFLVTFFDDVTEMTP